MVRKNHANNGKQNYSNILAKIIVSAVSKRKFEMPKWVCIFLVLLSTEGCLEWLEPSPISRQGSVGVRQGCGMEEATHQ